MGQTVKILHLEDLPEDAELVQREVTRSGLDCEFKTVDDKVSFKDALCAFKPDIVLSDHSLPFFSSYEALCVLQTSLVNIPFILVTATVSEEFAVGIIKKGAADYVLKDRLQRLPSAISKALESKRIETEHTSFLQQIIANETLMSDAQALANFGSYSVYPITHEIKLSNEAYNIFGFFPGECMPTFQVFKATHYLLDEVKIRIQLKDVYIELSPSKKSYSIIDKNSRLKFISAEMKIEKNDSGEIYCIKGFLYNITQLKVAEIMLQQSEANLKTIFETTDTGYILFSKDQQVESFNKKAALFVETQTTLQLKNGQPLATYTAYEKREFVTQAFKNALAGQQTTYESQVIDSRGETNWYFCRWFPVTGNNDRKHGVMLAISDITDRKVIEIERTKISEDLVTRNNALEQFSYIVSHNLRAPVANIMGISSILRTTEKVNFNNNQFLEALDTSVIKLDEVVNDLNRILRINKHLNEKKQVVYFQQLVDEIKKQLQDTIEKSEATINSNFSAAMYTHAVKSFFYHIFFNLLHNSLVYKNDDVPLKINITSGVTNNKTTLQFTDNGKGIDLAKFGNKIFGLYQRFDTTVDGKGVGLCTVKTLVDSVGGTIGVTSTPGKGTTFLIELPTY